MCGIAGVINLSGNANNNEEVYHMLQAIKHRGTQQVIKTHGKATIGFTRLPITNLGMSQPFEGEWTIYLNGEIYNYKELGHGSELDVISNGLKREGLPFVSKLNGMFIIVAIHGDDVFIFRDRYGIKPLYYTIKNNQFIFGSEIKALLNNSNVKPKINLSSEISWLAYQNYFNNETLIQDVYLLEKATITKINGQIKSYKYWSWTYKNNYVEYDKAIEKVRELVIKSIKNKIPDEVKFGACLSGGVDSNIIVCNLPDCKTFTVGYKGVDDETELAKINAKHHFEIIYDELKHFKETIYHLDDLRVGASWSNYGLYELASKYIKVLFDGTGGDELFGGYVWRYDMSKNYEAQILNRTSFKGNYSYSYDSLHKRMTFDAEHFMQGVLLAVDKLSMAHTIEVRLPFLDNELVDYVLSLPIEYLQGKILLKSAFPEIGEKILNSPKKGFSSPDWISGEGSQPDKWSIAALKEYKDTFINGRLV